MEFTEVTAVHLIVITALTLVSSILQEVVRDDYKLFQTALTFLLSVTLVTYAAQYGDFDIALMSALVCIIWGIVLVRAIDRELF